MYGQPLLQSQFKAKYAHAGTQIHTQPHNTCVQVATQTDQ